MLSILTHDQNYLKTKLNSTNYSNTKSCTATHVRFLVDVLYWKLFTTTASFVINSDLSTS